MSATFPAMGTEVTVIAPSLSDDALLAAAEGIAGVFADVEDHLSRFRPDSELSRLNRATAPFAASPLLFEALRRARGYFELTEALFDPAVGAALVAAGYDRSFAPGRLDRAARPGPPVRSVRFDGVVLDAATRTVRRPAGLLLDLGGCAKGFAVDLAAATVASPVAIDAGGDAVLRGGGPSGEGWQVDVEDPRDASRTLLTLRVRDRAVATSAPNRRRWRAGEIEQHHLIDPRTGAPARSDLAQVTVLAPRAELADVMAKTTLLLGADAGARWLAGREGLGAVLVATTGGVRLVGELEVERGG